MLPFNKIAELVIPTISAYIAFYIGNRFAHLGQLISSAISAFSLILILLILMVIWFSVQKTGIVDNRFFCLGNWIQTLKIKGETYVSLITVRHSLIRDEFYIDGESYSLGNLNIAYATWHSIAVSFAEDNRLIYVQLARVQGKNVNGFTTMNFSRSDGRRYYGGFGNILDDDENIEPLDFIFEVRDNKLTKSLLGKRRIKGPDDRIQFLSSFIKHNNIS